jgi:hypothetical protein
MTAHARPKMETDNAHQHCDLCGNPSETTSRRAIKCGACGGSYRGKVCDACTLAFRTQDFCALAEEGKSVMLRSPGPTTHNTASYLAADVN